jgi:hypothetical protein
VQEAMYKNNITKSANNFIFTTGSKLNASAQYDIILTNHTTAHVEVWSQIWTHPNFDGLDMAADLTIDCNADIGHFLKPLSRFDQDQISAEKNTSYTPLTSTPLSHHSRIQLSRNIKQVFGCGLKSLK